MYGFTPLWCVGDEESKFDLGSIIATVIAVNSSLSTLDVTAIATGVSDLYSLGGNFASLTSQLSSSVASLQAFDQSRCGPGSTLLPLGSDCTCKR